jgi:hypothetical protein
MKLLFASAMLVAASAASAVTVTVSHVYDPANILIANITGEPVAPFALDVGDTLDLTITFLGGVTVTAVGEDGLWLLALTGDFGATLQTTGTLEFLGASGNVVAGPIPLAQTNSSIHVGSYYSSGLYRTDANPISFTGLRQIITIDSSDVAGPRTYNRIALTHFAGVVEGGVIPEPATWAMLIAGFGLVGGALRRARPALA